ncbi:hypothetical protein HK103_003798 [Boothiomyces macroporosus]|uniref:Serine/threonine-protein kinase Tel1 n=1 Tax=Boothiomyces macroporosus TaxID=261099 RepID=A0AAD5Y6A1_9FUNG|nr:hypothetical protein HK103_003798 [Boothiomyces macroporosus]
MSRDQKVSWEVDIIRNLNAKVKDKNTALSDLRQWVNEPRSLGRLSDTSWETLLTSYISFIEKEREQLRQKVKANNRPAINHIALVIGIFKDMIVLASQEQPMVLNNKILKFILHTSNTNQEDKLITAPFTKCLVAMCSQRIFRERLDNKEWHSIVDYCMDFFLKESELQSTFDRADRRTECLDLATCFSAIVGGTFANSVITDANELLTFISQYISLYQIENLSFEQLLNTSIKILLFLDIDNLDLSFAFLKAIFHRLVDLYSSKNETLKLAILRLFRIYIAIGNQRDVEEEGPGFLKNCYRLLSLLTSLEKQPPFIPLGSIHILEESICTRNMYPDTTILSWTFINLLAELCFLEIKNPNEFASQQSSETVERPRKKSKIATGAFLTRLLNNSDVNCQIFGLQILIILLKLYPQSLKGILNLYANDISVLFTSHDVNVQQNAAFCLCMVAKNPTMFIENFDCNSVFDTCLPRVVGLGEHLRPTIQLITFLLEHNQVSSEKLNGLVNFFSFVEPCILNEDGSKCLARLLAHPSILDKSMYQKIVESLFNGLQPNSAHSKNVYFHQFMVSTIYHIFFTKKSKFETDQTPILEEKKLFDWEFQKLYEKLVYVSGTSGQVLMEQMYKENTLVPQIQADGKERLVYQIKDAISTYLGTLEALKDEEQRFLCSLTVAKIIQFLPSAEDFADSLREDLNLISANQIVESVDINSAVLLEHLQMLSSFAGTEKAFLWPFSEDLTLQILLQLLDIKDEPQLSPTDSNFSDFIAERKASHKLNMYEITNYGKNINYLDLSEFDRKMHILVQNLGSLSKKTFKFTEFVDVMKEYVTILIESKEFETNNFWLLVLDKLKEKLKEPPLDGSYLFRQVCIQFLTFSFNKVQDDLDILSLKNSSDKLISYLISHFELYPTLVKLDISRMLLSLSCNPRLKVIANSCNPVGVFLDSVRFDIFEYKFHLALEFLPLFFKSIDKRQYHKVVDSIRKYVVTTDTNDVQNIGNSLIYGCILRSIGSADEGVMVSLLQLAADQPSFDTIPLLFERISKEFGFKSVSDLLELYLDNMLRNWTSDFDEFPIYLFQCDTITLFTRKYPDSVALYYYNNERFCEIVKMTEILSISELLNKAFAKLYSTNLVKKNNEGENILRKLSEMDNKVFLDVVLENFVPISFNLLKMAHGMQYFDAKQLPVVLENTLLEIGNLSPISNNTTNIQSIISGLEYLVGCKAEDFPDKISMKTLYLLFHQMNVYLNKQSFVDKQLSIINNGYTLLIILAQRLILHPLIYQTVVRNLLQYVGISTLTRPICQLINYLTNLSKKSGEFVAISNHAATNVLVLSSYCYYLEEGRDLLVDTMNGIITVSTSFLAPEQAHHYQNALLVGLDPELPCFKQLIDKYDVKISSISFLTNWLIGLDLNSFVSKSPFLRLSKALDCKENIEIIKEFKKQNPLMNKLKEILDSEDSRLLEIKGIAAENIAKLTYYFKMDYQVENPFEHISDDSECYEGCKVVLEKLFEYLFHPDLETVECAFNVLSAIGPLDESQLAIAELNQSTKGHLDLFNTKGSQSVTTVREYPSVDDHTVWKSAGKSKEQWITNFTNALLNSFEYPDFFLYLGPMFEKQPQFAESILPYLVHYVLSVELRDAPNKTKLVIKDILSQDINQFFSDHSDENSLAKTILLEMIIFLFKTKPLVPYHQWLDLDFMNLAKAALDIQNHLGSIYFVELYFSLKINVNPPPTQIWQYLLDGYRGLHDTDGFHGTISSLDSDGISFLDLIQQKEAYDKDWMKLFSFRDALHQIQNPGSCSTDIIESLANSGHYQTVHQLTHNSKLSEEDIDAYGCMWRLGQWSTDIVGNEAKVGTNANNDFYHLLYQLEHSSNISKLYHDIDHALIAYSKLNNSFQDAISILELKEMVRYKCEADVMGNSNLFDVWKSRMANLLDEHKFDDLEQVLSIRTRAMNVLLHGKEKLQSDSVSYQPLRDFFKSHLSFVADLAINNNNLVLARNCELQLENLDTHSVLDSIKTKILSIKIEWARGHKTVAMKFFDNLLKSTINDTEVDAAFKVEMLHLYGMWSRDSRKSTPKTIVKNYLQPALKTLETGRFVNSGKYYFDLANYCDEIFNTMDSDETHARSVKLLHRRKSDLEEMKRLGESARKSNYIRKLTKQIEIDEHEISQYEDEKNHYLLLSVQNYMKTLAESDLKSEHSVFRVCSLWFSNPNNLEINAFIQKNFAQIATSKFLILMHQLSARFAVKNLTETFFETLKRLIEAIVIDYPYQSLPYILALRNVASEKSTQSTSLISGDTIDIFISKIRKETNMERIVFNMEKLFKGYLAAAYQPIPKSKESSRRLTLDSSCILLKIKAEAKIPVITLQQNIPVPKSYANIVYIERFESSFNLPGGINAPKVLKCVASNGKTYRQLVKAKDDLRQDSVLSSVFNVVNMLLAKQIESRKRKLSIRTYKIVPLAPQAGVLEWVDGTVPIGNMLIQSHPNQRIAEELSRYRTVMKSEHDKKGSTLESKLKVYRKIEKAFPPIFGAVFFEMYRDPKIWYENRMRYVQSLAASSIAGYMLGIGDRHCQNILFDKNTAEVVHIDLGIAFDQGKLLSTPELVPFRLTRNLVHAMGITGVEGVFKRGCEETLKILQTESDFIFTLLDVFRHDPLYSWTVSAQKLKNIQKDEQDDEPEYQKYFDKEISGNEEADIALFGVRKKLSSNLSIECQVEELVNSAMDPNNLCRMYPGWQSWI